jgi:hypothetical protein
VHFALAQARCDSARVDVAPGEPALVACGGRGRHVLEVEASPR